MTGMVVLFAGVGLLVAAVVVFVRGPKLPPEMPPDWPVDWELPPVLDPQPAEIRSVPVARCAPGRHVVLDERVSCECGGVTVMREGDDVIVQMFYEARSA